MGLRTWLGIKKPKPRPRTWHGPYSDGLWGEVELALSYGGLAPEIAFNANAQDSAYRLGFAPLPWLDDGNCRLFVETLDTLGVARISRSHSYARPVVPGGSLLAIDIHGSREFLDGTNRANRIVAGKIPGPHRVIIVEVLPARKGWPRRQPWHSAPSRENALV